MEKVLKKSLVRKIVYFTIIVVLTIIDQITKQLAVAYIMPNGTIPLIKFGDTEVLNFTYCENTGMSFSLLEGQRIFLIAVPLILIVGVTVIVFMEKLCSKRTDIMIALAALAGGGLGNLIDRVFQGYVVDFIDFRIINFAIFNFADICAVCGGIYFGIMLAIDEIKEDKAKKNAKENNITDGKESGDEEA